MNKTRLIRLAILLLVIVAMTGCAWSIGGGEKQGDDHREDKQKDTSDRR
jgi:hypothetical protein